MKQENTLLRSQLQTRLGELAAAKAKAVALEQEVGGARQEVREAEARLQGLALVQVRWAGHWGCCAVVGLCCTWPDKCSCVAAAQPLSWQDVC